MYISNNRIYRCAVIILLAAFILSSAAGCKNNNAKSTPLATPNISKSPAVTQTPAPSATPAQTEPGSVPIPSSSVDTVHVKGLSIDREVIELSVGQSSDLTVSIEPDNSTRKAIVWTTDNESVAKISKTSGTTVKVSASAPGTALIKAVSEDSGRIAACIVTVKSPGIDVTGLTLSSADVTMSVGSTLQIAATVTPSNATNKALTWSSSAPAVAMASDDGTLTAIGIGTAVITVKSVSGGKTATCTVHVIEAVSGISISPTAQPMKIGGTLSLTVTATPANSPVPKLIWSSSNTAVASVANGLVTAKGVGEAVITAKTEDGKFSAYCTVYVSR